MKSRWFFSMSIEINLVLLGLTLTSFMMRMWRLEEPREVVFDEFHFGKFINMYLKQVFFFDIHPPLGKLLLAGAGYMADTNVTFPFERIGDEYPCDLPIWHLRLIPALCGSLLVPIVYLIITEIGYTDWTAVQAAVLVLFDNALITESRFILLDTMLLFFTFTALILLFRLRKMRQRCFSASWWLCMLLLGIAITCAVSVKYSAILMVSLIYLVVAYDFWQLVGDRSLSVMTLIHHFMARFSLLIVLPVMVYISFFYIHLSVLSKAGPNDSQMTSAFSASLEGGLSLVTKGQPLFIVYGSQITLRHTHNHMCWLHSHPHNYPFKYDDGRGSSGQQQVTCYSFKDVNNWWIVKDPKSSYIGVTDTPKQIKHGDIIQLVHGRTTRLLNSHDVAAPVSPNFMEVSGYINYNISIPEQSLWKVIISNIDTEGDTWKAVSSHVRLIHVNTSQAIRMTNKLLGEWGFYQHEVATDRILQQDDTVWNVEEHQYAKASDNGDNSLVQFQPSETQNETRKLNFWGKFWELQMKMLTKNFEINHQHRYQSSPQEWPFTQRGIAFWLSKNSNMQIYFLGNPVTWCVATVSILVFISILITFIIRDRRKCQDLTQDEWERLVVTSVVFLGGWILNYLPYFLMDRTLFLHHYLPALLCKVMLLAATTEWIYSTILRSSAQQSVFIGLIAIFLTWVLAAWFNLVPFTYGHIELTSQEMISAQWMDTWTFLTHR
ncbi:protein O-mannosyl-transferase 1-like [Asterias rubens]|uniref:protein O-mannosyl-transferase 1-like n=1 Tax=Asterias rubens TaxID=7604 RepID=UPI0014550E59|nr:protein O-mannosyl-transferase 1-like [Asterias rubens]XP_033647477.1 protein O-mannosyl-transferase 1-like [Asterias rubens]XP_033647478.1 protein O-mannosyl-transferase 1-like [Asterias rubens]XP_033647479.1 protein O-mannosyl-transferase 1-like [Asterias rubens]